jgi:hypothetical protein
VARVSDLTGRGYGGGGDAAAARAGASSAPFIGGVEERSSNASPEGSRAPEGTGRPWHAGTEAQSLHAQVGVRLGAARRVVPVVPACRLGRRKGQRPTRGLSRARQRSRRLSFEDMTAGFSGASRRCDVASLGVQGTGF